MKASDEKLQKIAITVGHFFQQKALATNDSFKNITKQPATIGVFRHSNYVKVGIGNDKIVFFGKYSISNFQTFPNLKIF